MRGQNHIQPYVGFGPLHQIVPDFSIFGELALVPQFYLFNSFITSSLHLFFGRPLVLTPPISNLFNQFYIFHSMEMSPPFYSQCF